MSNSKTKLILLIVVMGILISGCIKNETVPVITPTITKTPTPTLTIPAPTTTPEGSLKDVFFWKDVNYQKTTGSRIHSGEMNGQYISIIGKVFNVLPRYPIVDFNGSRFDVIEFQIWGNPLSRTEPIYIVTLPEKINGSIREGISIEIKGFVTKEWMTGTNMYGGPINQPLIYASNVTVIPEFVRD